MVNKKEVELGLLELVLAIFFIAILFSSVEPTITGKVISSTSTDISFNNLIYNDSLIEISSGNIQLIQQEINSSWITYEYLNFGIGNAYKENGEGGEDDITEDVIELDGEDKSQKNDKYVRVEPSQNLKNNDVISFYLLDKKTSNVNICSDDDCTINYGTFNFPNIEDYYNVTISNIETTIDEFYIKNDNNIKMDYVTFYRTTEILNSEINLTYENAIVETPNYDLNENSLSGTFSSEETLNNQQVDYFYSLDSNDYVATTANITLDGASTIKFKAELTTDSTATPLISSMNFNYSYDVPCVENWEEDYLDCQPNDSKLKYYIDTNTCGTTLSLPEDNSTYAECDYCTPSWIETNSTCQSNNQITGDYTDSNDCFSTTSLSSDNNIPENNTYDCEYITATDFSTIDFTETDLSNITDLVIEKEEYGAISFSESISLEEMVNLNENIEITSTSIFINTTAIPEFNKSAVLTLKNLTFNNPIILRDGEACNDCSKLDYNNGDIIFSVPHFTLYEIVEGCGNNVCEIEESCSSCSLDCGSCPTSSSEGSGGKTTFTRPLETKTETQEVIEKVEVPKIVETTKKIEEKEDNNQEIQYEKNYDTSTLDTFTGNTITELEEPTLKRKVNGTLISIIIVNILFLVYHFKFKKKNKPFPFVEDIKKFGIK
jgi:hypothetical protein